MLNRDPEPMSVAAFFAWQERQAERYELVGGVPVRMRAGARNVHDDIVVNLLAALHAGLRGSGCPPFIGDGSVETRPGQIRRPDLGVDCGARDPNALKAAEPQFVAEVLSPNTRDFDAFAISLPLAAIYDGIAFPARPRLVQDAGPGAPAV